MADKTPHETYQRSLVPPAYAITRRVWIQTAAAVFLIATTAAGLIYWVLTSSRIYVGNARIEAPVIDLAPTTSGILQNIFVEAGDEVIAGAPVAQVGREIIRARTDGVIIRASADTEEDIHAGESVVQMIDPTQLRVVGKVKENEGLGNIMVGDPIFFSIDAFDGKQYSGVIDEVSATPDEVQEGADAGSQLYTVKGRFDVSVYSQIKNGMSAHMWIYIQ